MNPIIKKFKIPLDQKEVLILHAPDGVIEKLDLPLVVNSDIDELRKSEKRNFILAFVSDKKTLETLFPKIASHIDEKGLLWIAYPKKSSGIITDLSRDEGWEILKIFNYRPVSLISFDESWSVFRLRPKDQVKVAKKPDIPEIDYQKREVFQPEDMQQAILENGLHLAFNKLAFTHKKEFVEAVVEAKKPETRKRRIDKMIESLKLKI